MRNRFDLLSLALIFVAMVRIATTLTILSATTDEPMHVTAGVELLLKHRYSVLPENPPPPRVLFAAPLVAAGVDFDPNAPAINFVGMTLYSRGHYRTNLFLARIGNLVFFVLAALVTWRLGRRALGEAGGALTTFLFTTQPMMLGFSGIANNDMASVTGLALSLLAFVRWMDKRTIPRAIVFGLAYGFAFGCKFSSIAFVPAACAVLCFARFRADADFRNDWRAALRAIPVVFVACLIAIWASYGFTIGPLNAYEYDPPESPHGLGLRMLAHIDPSMPIPAPYLIIGMTRLLAVAEWGLGNYALGKWSADGWWWYFPFAVALKTTIASLILAFCVSRRVWREWLVWLGTALAILALALPSNLDLGIRYVIPMYVPLTIAMAIATMAMLRDSRRVIRIIAIVLLAWHGIASLAAHPQYFAYFNEIGRRDPSYFLVDSNLDWGQDALLLARELRKQKVSRVGLGLVGMHHYDGMGFPPSYNVEPKVPVTGWIAVSDHMYRLGQRDGGWTWLDGKPYRRVGAAIRLYYIPPT